MSFFMEEFQNLKIQLQDIISATDNFSPSKLIGHGGFGQVYKGEISLSGEPSMVALKRLDRKFGQGNTEFWKEIMMLSKCKHENLVSLLHFCFEGDERILVYEYASRGSLDRHLSDVSLTWMHRLKICIGVARGLNYLHDPKETKQRVLHRDIKSSNILLDEEWNAKVSDFGLSKVGPANQPHTYLVSNVVGTFGYCDPSYFETRLLSKESDVYSFGVVLFEMMCGRLCCEYRNGEMIRILVPMWRKCFEENRLDDIVFDDLKVQIQPDSLMTFSTIANRCLQRDHKSRPTMVEIVHELEVAIEQQLGANTKKESREIKQKGVGFPSVIERNLFGFKELEAATKKQRKLRQWLGIYTNKETATARNLFSFEELEVAIKEQSKFVQRLGLYINEETATASLQLRPPLLMMENGKNCWWVFDKGLRYGIRLSALPSDNYAAYAHKESLIVGSHLLVSGKDAKSNGIWQYELATNKWYKTPSMITPRSLFASATCGNSAFVAGGIILVEGGTSENVVVHNTVEKYDQETRSWTPLPRMTKPRKLCSGCYMDNKLYVIGGSNKDEGELKCGEFFDQETNKWTLINGMLNDINIVHSNIPPSRPFIAVLNNELYFIEVSSNELKFYQKNTNSWKSLGSVPVRFNNKGCGVAFVSFCNMLLVIGESTTIVSTSARSMAIYACTPEPKSDHLPEWKLRDYGNTKLNRFIYNCSVMQ